MILTSDLKARVEKEVGTEICPVFFQKAEKYARRKLDLANERAGRKYGGLEELGVVLTKTVKQ